MSNRTSSIVATRGTLRLNGDRGHGRQESEILQATEARRLLAGIRELAPIIKRRAAEIETERRVPQDLLEALKSLGVFRIFIPYSRGGLELDLPRGLEIIEALATIDGSVGWTAMIGSGSHLFAPLLPHETYDQVYRAEADVMLAGSIQPVGTAEETEGGWRVSGRWPFASGCVHADWMAGFCVMRRGGETLPDPVNPKAPLIRAAFMPARDWEIEDTWHAAGLKGTASHHIVLRDKLVPSTHFLELAHGRPCVSGPLYQSVEPLLPIVHGSFSVGVAQGALDDIVEMAATGRQQFRAAVPMRESEIFQAELGRIAADLKAAKAFLQAEAARLWRRALMGTLKDESLLVEAALAGTWIATTCVHIADACFTLGGGSAVYDSSPLQRRLRDLHVAAQHATVHRRNYTPAGKLLLSPPGPHLDRGREQ